MAEQSNNQGGSNQSANNQPKRPPADPKTTVKIPREQKELDKKKVLRK